jgi:acyl-CoA reductase-like NAD-dependent aldehyde dehydrogenase
LDPKVTHGPQADKLQYESVLKFIEAGKNSTAQMLTGGKPKGDKGYFIEPTIFLNPPDDNDVVTKEIFGYELSLRTLSRTTCTR